MNQFLAGHSVRRNITSYIDASAVVERLKITRPVWFYDADLNGSLGVTAPTIDLHCVMIDLKELLQTVEEVQDDSQVLVQYPLLAEQLPSGVEYSFGNLVKADIAHEMSHLADKLGLGHLLLEAFKDYNDRPGEVRARQVGRELFGLINLDEQVLLRLAN